LSMNFYWFHHEMSLTELTSLQLLNPKQSKHFILYSIKQFNVSIFIFCFYKFLFNNPTVQSVL
jgi:hypothetical protein